MRPSHFFLMALLGLSGASLKAREEDPVVVCYYASSSTYRPGKFRFNIEDIDPRLCTHMIYAFAGLSSDEGVVISIDPWNDLSEDYGSGGFERFTKLKMQNPEVKVLLSIGGQMYSESVSKMVSSMESRLKFITSAVDFLKKYGFEGLDFQWYYSTQTGTIPDDKENFAIFFAEIHQVFAQHGLMLTASVSGVKKVIDEAYDVPALAKYLDLINVMTFNTLKFDERGEATDDVSMNGIDPDEQFPIFNALAAMHYWVEKGAPKSKLLIGIYINGLMHHSHVHTEGISSRGLNAMRDGISGPPEWIHIMPYNEICDLISGDPSSWSIVRDPGASPTATNGTMTIEYEDEESTSNRSFMSTVIGYRGVTAWSFDSDDFLGACRGVKYPAIRAIWNGIDEGNSRKRPIP